MADPLTIIGTAASITGIIEVLAKTISTLHELHNRWQEADFTFISLIAQVTALKAALSKLEEWMDVGLDEGQDPYHQLVMDLEVSVTCCRMLTRKMEAEISEINRSAADKLDLQSKLKFMGKNGVLVELQRLVEQQTSALTLLLTACNCGLTDYSKAISDQKLLLEKSSTRKIFRRIQDDTSSLYVQRDSMSLYSRISQSTDNLSKISKVFEFDRELFISKVYDRALRGSLKDTVENLRRQKTSRESITTLALGSRDSTQDLELEEKKRSQLIDRTIRQDRRRLQREYKVLVLGDDDCCQIFLRQTKLVHMGGFTSEELKEFKTAVTGNVRLIMKKLDAVLKQSSIELDNKTEEYARLLVQELSTVPTGDTPSVSAGTAKAVQGLWTSEQFATLLQSTDVDFPTSTEYFIESIDRIAQEDYIPTASDVLRTNFRKKGIQEYKLSMGSDSIHMFNLSGERSESKKWIHQFESVISIIFFVDLGCYNQLDPEDWSRNRLMKSLDLFQSLVNSRWFMYSSFILILSNVGDFRKKLVYDPLSNHFLEYEGANDLNQASKYILSRFSLIAGMKSMLFPHLAEADDPSNFTFAKAAVKESILNSAFSHALPTIFPRKAPGGFRPRREKDLTEESSENWETLNAVHPVREVGSEGEVKCETGEGGEKQMQAGQDISLGDRKIEVENMAASEIGVAL